MDELSLLEADSIGAEAVRAAEAAKVRLPAPDFTGSLEFIDSLASRRALTLSRRDVATITTAAFDAFSYLSPLNVPKAVPGSTDVDFSLSTDFRPLGDARRFDPESDDRPPRALVRSASRVVSPQTPYRVPPGWRNPLDPTRSPADIERAMREAERRVWRTPFKNYDRRFDRPNQVVICLKRKIRRQVMNAFGYAGNSGFKPPVRTYWSKVVC